MNYIGKNKKITIDFNCFLLPPACLTMHFSLKIGFVFTYFLTSYLQVESRGLSTGERTRNQARDYPSRLAANNCMKKNQCNKGDGIKEIKKHKPFNKRAICETQPNISNFDDGSSIKFAFDSYILN